MQALSEGLRLYHGSYAPVEIIDLSKRSPGKDFGRGFCLTSSHAQALAFIPLSIKKRFAATNPNTKPEGYVSAFSVKSSDGLKVLAFDGPDAHWLHFVAANRRRGLFADLLSSTAQFDVVIGKIANDQTARTLQLYVSGAFGVPGTSEADAIAISLLLPNRLEDQFCFRTPKALSCLAFEGCEHHVF